MEISHINLVCCDHEIKSATGSYKLTLRAEMYKEEDGYDFTGCYEGTLVTTKGEQSFIMEPGYVMVKGKEVRSWDLQPELADQELIPILDAIISDFRKGSALKAKLN